MKQAFIGDSGKNTRLILIFAGWGMDDNLFSDLSFAGYDVMVVWDYTDRDFEESFLNGYSEIYLFAWSFGVYIASLLLSGLNRFPLMLRVAINGSVTPVDDFTGIPESIFQGTLSGLDERNLSKFYRRMCGTREEYESFAAKKPQRDIDDLRHELSRIFEMSREESGDVSGWDRAVIAEDDRIFPCANLARAWAALPRVRYTSGGHLPDFTRIIEQEIIDKELVAARFSVSASTYDDAALVQRAMAEVLWNHVSGFMPDSHVSLLEIGSGTGMLTSLYAPGLNDADITLWDLAPRNLNVDAKVVAGDAESMIADVADGSFDVILSAATVQWFNNLPRFIRTAASKLKKGGVMALSTFGTENMKEITGLTRLPLRYYTLSELEAMVPDCCVTLVAVEELRSMEFASPRDVMLHLNHTGVNGLKHVAMSYAEILAKYPRENGVCKLTYHPQYIVIKRKDNE
ncbi:MAG: DUF452 family protein [Lachnospiraceae bacterium]|nr:DUF452 family protein [Lachnospiraceae bacterium]